MTDKVQKIREEVARMHNLLPVMDGDNISVNYADRICTTLEMYIDSLQEEPVSNPIDFEQELYNHFGQVKDFTTGMRIARYFYEMGRKQEEPVSEELEEELSKLLKECEVDAEYVHQDFLHIVARHFANWQKDKDFQYVKKECERTGGCCDNDIAIEAAKRHPYYYASEMEAYANIGFKEGAMWQKQQDQDTIELAEDHAMLAGMEKMKEQMMAKAIEAVVSQVPCLNEIILYNPSSVDKYYLPQEMNKLGLNKGDKVKVIVIKED